MLFTCCKEPFHRLDAHIGKPKRFKVASLTAVIGIVESTGNGDERFHHRHFDAYQVGQFGERYEQERNVFTNVAVLQPPGTSSRRQDRALQSFIDAKLIRESQM